LLKPTAGQGRSQEYKVMEETRKPIVELRKARVTYANGEGVAQANLAIAPGEFVFLVGPNGAGKTTLLKMLCLELLPVAGHVRVGSYHSLYSKPREIPFVRRSIGIVFQDFRLLPDRDVTENLAIVLEVLGKDRREIKRRVLRVLAEVGLSHTARKRPPELSAGEQQRIALARAIVNDPSLLLVDEPTGQLDPEAADQIMHLLQRLNSRGVSVLLATHNYELVRKYPGRILYIQNGFVSG